MDWQNLMRQLAPLRTRWDVALLANLAGSDAPVRPVDLINAINAQSDDGQLSWKVMEDRMRRLEASGYVARREVPHGPRESRYWLLPRGDRLLRALDLLDTWYGEQEGARQGPDWQRPGCECAGASTRLSAQGGRLASGTEAAADQWTGRT